MAKHLSQEFPHPSFSGAHQHDPDEVLPQPSHLSAQPFAIWRDTSASLHSDPDLSLQQPGQFSQQNKHPTQQQPLADPEPSLACTDPFKQCEPLLRQSYSVSNSQHLHVNSSLLSPHQVPAPCLASTPSCKEQSRSYEDSPYNPSSSSHSSFLAGHAATASDNFPTIPLSVRITLLTARCYQDPSTHHLVAQYQMKAAQVEAQRFHELYSAGFNDSVVNAKYDEYHSKLLDELQANMESYQKSQWCHQWPAHQSIESSYSSTSSEATGAKSSASCSAINQASSCLHSAASLSAITPVSSCSHPTAFSDTSSVITPVSSCSHATSSSATSSAMNRTSANLSSASKTSNQMAENQETYQNSDSSIQEPPSTFPAKILAALNRGRPTKSAGPISPLALKVMTAWYERNRSHPYPSYSSCQVMANACDISTAQVKKWFSNKRHRDGNTRHVSDVAKNRKRLRRAMDDREETILMHDVKSLRE